ncbi:MAG TPA: hypothetical protein VNJ29_01320 [Candidatus Nitrosotenuis sp.]|nr:hypothetical protein [Candidatus Nitrosotenuis sp.]
MNKKNYIFLLGSTLISMALAQAMEIKTEPSLQEIPSPPVHNLLIQTDGKTYSQVFKELENSFNPNIKSVSFKNKHSYPLMEEDEFVQIARFLRQTETTALEFVNYDMTAELAGKIIHELKGSKVHTLGFSGNRIGRNWIDDDLHQTMLVPIEGWSNDEDRRRCVNQADAELVKTAGQGLEYLFPILNELNIRSISLQKNQLTDRDAMCLAQNFPHSNLTSVDLRKNVVENEGAIAIAESLQNSPQLRTLLLGENKIGNDGVITLFKKLNESSVCILDLEGYSYHEHLYDEETIEAIAPLLKGNNLQILSLMSRNISDRSAKSLAQNFPGSQLTRINLRYNHIGDEGVLAIAASLTHCPHLTTLLLGGNQIGRLGLSAIFAHLKESNLRTLDLGNQESFNGEDIEEIAPTFKDTQLQILHMGGCPHLGDKGIMTLAKGFRESPLSIVDLSGANIKACARLFAEHLKGTNIHTVYFAPNVFNDNERALLKKAYPAITWFFDSSEGFLLLDELMWQTH